MTYVVEYTLNKSIDTLWFRETYPHQASSDINFIMGSIGFVSFDVNFSSDIQINATLTFDNKQNYINMYEARKNTEAYQLRKEYHIENLIATSWVAREIL